MYQQQCAGQSTINRWETYYSQDIDMDTYIREKFKYINK